MAHFQCVLWTSFQVSFSLDVGTFLRPSEVPVGTIFDKKNVPKIASRKGDPGVEHPTFPVSDGSQRRRLVCA